MRGYRILLLLTFLLAFIVVVLGAYVRLSDAGLGCPDWPGCYGHFSVPQSEAALRHAEQAFPDKPLDSHKAWKEMAHRYCAGTLGILILGISVLAWRSRGRIGRGLPTFLLGLVIFQAMLGMWTVTLLLKPAVVSAHLLGGMSVLAVLAWLVHRHWGHVPAVSQSEFQDLRPWARLALLVLAVQIFLGGWTSANYAALACSGLPTCNGAWLPTMDFANAFHMVRELGETADGGQLPFEALVAIHWSHRVGALVTLLYLGWLIGMLVRRPNLRHLGWLMAALLLFQIGLGVSNVLFSLPLPVAVAHNAGAALLLVSVIVLNSKTTPLSKEGSKP